MSDKKISELNIVTDLSEDDLLPVLHNGVTSCTPPLGILNLLSLGKLGIQYGKDTITYPEPGANTTRKYVYYERSFKSSPVLVMSVQNGSYVELKASSLESVTNKRFCIRIDPLKSSSIDERYKTDNVYYIAIGEIEDE